MKRSPLAILLIMWILGMLVSVPCLATGFAEFDGKQRLDFPQDPSFDLPSPATVEFWVQPSWRGVPLYSPCVLAVLGTKGVNFAIHITAEKDSILLYAGDDYLGLPFDFSDGTLHRVEIVSYSPEISEVRMDGTLIGMMTLGFADSPNMSLHIASLDGEQAPFRGSIGGIRFWRTALEDGVEPEPTFLVARSNFSEDGYFMEVSELIDEEFDEAVWEDEDLEAEETPTPRSRP